MGAGSSMMTMMREGGMRGNSNDTKICVIGGGPAGLHFAHLLKMKKGVKNIVVFEKENRIGGQCAWASTELQKNDSKSSVHFPPHTFFVGAGDRTILGFAEEIAMQRQQQQQQGNEDGKDDSTVVSAGIDRNLKFVAPETFVCERPILFNPSIRPPPPVEIGEEEEEEGDNVPAEKVGPPESNRKALEDWVRDSVPLPKRTFGFDQYFIRSRISSSLRTYERLYSRVKAVVNSEKPSKGALSLLRGNFESLIKRHQLDVLLHPLRMLIAAILGSQESISLLSPLHGFTLCPPASLRASLSPILLKGRKKKEKARVLIGGSIIDLTNTVTVASTKPSKEEKEENAGQVQQEEEMQRKDEEESWLIRVDFSQSMWEELMMRDNIEIRKGCDIQRITRGAASRNKSDTSNDNSAFEQTPTRGDGSNMRRVINDDEGVIVEWKQNGELKLERFDGIVFACDLSQLGFFVEDITSEELTLFCGGKSRSKAKQQSSRKSSLMSLLHSSFSYPLHLQVVSVVSTRIPPWHSDGSTLWENRGLTWKGEVDSTEEADGREEGRGGKKSNVVAHLITSSSSERRYNNNDKILDASKAEAIERGKEASVVVFQSVSLEFLNANARGKGGQKSELSTGTNGGNKESKIPEKSSSSSSRDVAPPSISQEEEDSKASSVFKGLLSRLNKKSNDDDHSPDKAKKRGGEDDGASSGDEDSASEDDDVDDDDDDDESHRQLQRRKGLFASILGAADAISDVTSSMFKRKKKEETEEQRRRRRRKERKKNKRKNRGKKKKKKRKKRKSRKKRMLDRQREEEKKEREEEERRRREEQDSMLQEHEAALSSFLSHMHHVEGEHSQFAREVCGCIGLDTLNAKLHLRVSYPRGIGWSSREIVDRKFPWRLWNIQGSNRSVFVGRSVTADSLEAVFAHNESLFERKKIDIWLTIAQSNLFGMMRGGRGGAAAAGGGGRRMEQQALRKLDQQNNNNDKSSNLMVNNSNNKQSVISMIEEKSKKFFGVGGEGPDPKPSSREEEEEEGTSASEITTSYDTAAQTTGRRTARSTGVVASGWETTGWELESEDVLKKLASERKRESQ